MSTSDIVLKWVGAEDPNGAFVGGVPATDLTADQVTEGALPPGWTAEALIATGLYEKAGTKAAKETLKPDTGKKDGGE